MKNTALSDWHTAHGAKMVPFAGYNMPVQYTGVNDEHVCVREKVGIFDVSHMGEFHVRGAGALDLIQKVTSNDASLLTPGKVQYSCLPNATGGIVDDLLVYCLAENDYMLVVNASNIEKDLEWINGHNTFDCEVTNDSEGMSLFAIQGPKATEVLTKLTDAPLGDMAYYTLDKINFCGVNDILISSTGYTGAGGFEIYLPNEHAEDFWTKILEAGKEFEIQTIGLAARDTLRLEMGFCLYGNDINDTTSPIEAGLGWITKFTKDFIGKDISLDHKENGTSRKLVGFVINDRGIARHGYEITDAEGNVIGEVTSGTMSPSTKKSVGMGYVATGMHKKETQIFIKVRNKSLSATVTRPPFISKS
ncbi:MAG: glycine cleavage system aminomethyltransferase GcvT [Flavobacteriales bacterium]